MKKINLLLIFVGVALSLGAFAIAQVPGSEVTALFLLDAAPLSGGNFTNTCMAGASAPCIDTDGGYNPTATSSVAGFVSPMTPAPWNQNLWFSSGTNQCVQASELCISATELLEVVCGSSVGISNAIQFMNAFPNIIWNAGGEPVALMQINCATYAANNPGLGLTGACSNGGCV